MKQLVRHITLACIFLWGISAAPYAQTTYYYSQEKIVDPVTKNTTSGSRHQAGLFITFNAKGCYDSDRQGFDVGNGFREKVSAGDRLVTYIGGSYWGDARYVVSAAKDRINIHTPDRILVYVRCQPPAGKNTSSLIKAPGDNPAIPAPPSPAAFPPPGGSPATDQTAMYLAHYRKLEQSLQEAFHAYERTMAGSYDSSRAGMARAISDIQRTMRAWRADARRGGVIIPVSPWETAQPGIGTIHYEKNHSY